MVKRKRQSGYVVPESIADLWDILSEEGAIMGSVVKLEKPPGDDYVGKVYSIEELVRKLAKEQNDET